MLQFISVCRHIGFHSEKVIGIPISFSFGCSCQAYPISIKIFENGFVLIVNRSMDFVKDDEIKMPYTKMSVTINIFLINQVNHRLVSAEDDARVQIVFLLRQIDRRNIRQKICEYLFGLIDERAHYDLQEIKHA